MNMEHRPTSFGLGFGLSAVLTIAASIAAAATTAGWPLSDEQWVGTMGYGVGVAVLLGSFVGSTSLVIKPDARLIFIIMASIALGAGSAATFLVIFAAGKLAT